MEINVDENIKIQTLVPEHAEELFELIVESRNHLKRWLPWVKTVESVSFVENFINETILRSDDKLEFAFVIMYNNKIAGRIGLYHIHPHNKIAEIGYWIGQQYAGMGIVTKCCKALIDYGFEVAELNRIEIKCAVENTGSIKIPEKLGFQFVAILRQAELLDEGFVDLKLYAMLRSEWAP